MPQSIQNKKIIMKKNRKRILSNNHQTTQLTMQPQPQQSNFMDQKYAEIQSIINKNSTAIYSTNEEMSPGEPATVVMSEQHSEYPNLRGGKDGPSFISNNNIGSLMSGVINQSSS